MKNRCWVCREEVICGGDFDYEDLGLTGEGIVSNFSCSNKKCNVHYEMYQHFD